MPLVPHDRPLPLIALPLLIGAILISAPFSANAGFGFAAVLVLFVVTLGGTTGRS